MQLRPRIRHEDSDAGRQGTHLTPPAMQTFLRAASLQRSLPVPSVLLASALLTTGSERGQTVLAIGPAFHMRLAFFIYSLALSLCLSVSLSLCLCLSVSLSLSLSLSLPLSPGGEPHERPAKQKRGNHMKGQRNRKRPDTLKSRLGRGTRHEGIHDPCGLKTTLVAARWHIGCVDAPRPNTVLNRCWAHCSS